MTYALTLLVLLAPGDAALAPPVAAAVKETLGPDTAIEARLWSRPPDDAAAFELGRRARAQAVAVIDFAAPDRRTARVLLYRPDVGRRVVRELTFAPADAALEKGRALGFTLASMLPETTEPPAETGPQAAPAPDSEALVARTTTVAPERPAEAEPRTASTPAPARAPQEPTAPPAPASRAPWTFSIDAAARGELALGGEGTVGGARLGGQYRLDDHLSLRLGAALGVGHVEALEGDLMVVDLGPGIVWRSSDAEPGRPWALALQMDAFARLQRLRRQASDSRAAESHGRFVPGVGVGVELMYALSREVLVFADAGGQALLGETDVLLRGAQVASFAPVGLRAGIGARARF